MGVFYIPERLARCEKHLNHLSPRGPMPMFSSPTQCACREYTWQLTGEGVETVSRSRPSGPRFTHTLSLSQASVRFSHQPLASLVLPLTLPPGYLLFASLLVLAMDRTSVSDGKLLLHDLKCTYVHVSYKEGERGGLIQRGA